MKTSTLQRLIFFLIAGHLHCSPAFADDTAPQDPASIFAACAQRKFADFPPPEYLELEDGSRVAIPRVSSGPMVPLGVEEEVHCSVIERQADLIAKAGPTGFDVAFQHLDHKDLYMRWIAVESLSRITSKRPLWYYFAKPGETWNSDADWSDRAKVVWKKWKAEQAGTGQPATRPESKSEGSKKPQPESEGRSR